jgi:phosphoglycerate dehydrogenase-like enzyme
MERREMTKVAVLDDWQDIARDSADWSALREVAEVTFFRDAFADEDDAASRLAAFDVVMAMRERTAFPASLVRRLPKLRLFSLTGRRAAAVDMRALAAQGVTVTITEGGDTGAGTAELALLLMLAAARDLPRADAAMRTGGFQAGIRPGMELEGRTLGVVGLGRLGQRMARYGAALGMRVIAWSRSLTPAVAAERGAVYAPLEELLALADVVSLHLVLSDRTRGLIDAAALARMKPGAILVNTSRGPLVDEAALIAALQAGRIVAALDVYHREPLPRDHPFRMLPNTVLTPHLGYVTRGTMEDFYRQGIENVLAFLAGRPIRVLPPQEGA